MRGRYGRYCGGKGGSGLVDEYLIRRVQNGDKTAMEKLIRRYYDKIYLYCYAHIRDIPTAQDLTQETFCSVIAHMNDYVHYDKFQNYLYVVAGNKCKDYYRKKKPVYLAELPELPENAPERGKPGPEESLFLRELVEQLPEELSAVVILRFYQDMKYQDIARVLQISNSLVKYRVKKAISLLRSEMERS